MAMSEQAARQDVVALVRALSDEGLVTGTSGNVSVRLGERILITPSGVDYASLEPEGIAVVDPTGVVLDPGASAPSSEVPLHLAIYVASEARAVVHTHSPWATAVGLVRDVLPAVHYGIRALGGPVRVAPYATFGSDELAAGVSQAIEGRRAALMRNHGMVAFGASLDEAAEHARRVEWLSQLYMRAARLGEPAVLSEEQLAEVARRAQRAGYRG